MTLKNVALAAICSFSLFSQYSSAHYDFVPKVEAGRVATGGSDDENGSVVGSLRVAGYDFGEIPADPYNIGDPGFNTQGPTAFTGGSTLRMTAVPFTATSYLGYWDGTGEPAFTAAPGDVSLAISGSPTRSVTYAAGAASYSAASPDSLLIGTFGSTGALHVHLTSSLLPTSGTAADGAYLIAFQLTNPSTGVAASEPLFIVYNNNLTEAQHDAAIDSAAATYASVPEPTSLAALGLAGVALLGRRRRVEETDEAKPLV